MFNVIINHICIFFRYGLFYFAKLHHIKLIIPLLAVFTNIGLASAQYMVEVLETNSFNQPVVRCEATGADFGDTVISFSFTLKAIGCGIQTVPTSACSDVHMPPPNITGCSNNFALVPRGNCNFSVKAYNVQNAFYNALILYNDKGKAPIPMSGSKYADLIRIPVVMINYECFQSLIGHYSAKNGYVITLKASPGYYDLIKYLVPFVAIVGFCFIVLFVSLVIRLCRERRRLAKKRLSRSNLKKIPTRKYKKGDPEETCAVCLEDFQENDKLRILPCRHAYHCKCIDVWLTKKRKVCPVCKRKVGPSSNDSSDSDSERASTSTTTITRENDPLLRNEHPMATSSSADFPYPQNSVPSISASNENSVYARALNIIKIPRLFRSNSANTSNINNGINVNENNTDAERLYSQQHQSGVFNHLATNLQNFKSSLNNKWQRLISRNQDNNLPHTLFDNEDTATTVTHDDLGFETTQHNQNEWENSQSNFPAGTSVGENSLTTVYSNQQVSVDIESLDRPESDHR